MRMVDYLACWDQVNLPDPVRVESAMRQAQLHEYVCAMEAEGALHAAPQANETDKNKRGRGRGRGFAKFAFLDEASAFIGTSREDGRMMVCPDLLAHVSAMVERDAGILKALRKAREERRALSGQ
eukprot:7873612-Pyramimonas_sp.AAC.1